MAGSSAAHVGFSSLKSVGVLEKNVVGVVFGLFFLFFLDGSLFFW